MDIMERLRLRHETTREIRCASEQERERSDGSGYTASTAALRAPLKQQIQQAARGANRDVRAHLFPCLRRYFLPLTTRPLWSPEARKHAMKGKKQILRLRPAAPVCRTRPPPRLQGTKAHRKQPGRSPPCPCRRHWSDWLDLSPGCVLVVRCCSCFRNGALQANAQRPLVPSLLNEKVAVSFFSRLRRAGDPKKIQPKGSRRGRKSMRKGAAELFSSGSYA
jgi:hypothetical protein